MNFKYENIQLYLYLEHKLSIAKKLEMTDFVITVEKGAWDLEIILNYTQRLK